MCFHCSDALSSFDHWNSFLQHVKCSLNKTLSLETRQGLICVVCFLLSNCIFVVNIKNHGVIELFKIGGTSECHLVQATVPLSTCTKQG